MKIIFSSLIITFSCISGFVKSKEQTFVGSTPAHAEVREFLGISSTDSIDFIRWKLEINENKFTVQCEYGIGKPGTTGFIVPKYASFPGNLNKTGNYILLDHAGKKLSLIEVNPYLLHLTDHEHQMLIGTGGSSYALNSTKPVKTDEFSIQSKTTKEKYPVVFVGRTPCQDLSRLFDMDKRATCEKIKWRIILFTDSITGKPSYYYYGGNKFTKEPMKKGRWQIVTGKNGRQIYQIFPEQSSQPMYLVKGDENILFFTDSEGNLLVGNENLSYTLNRRLDGQPPVIF